MIRSIGMAVVCFLTFVLGCQSETQTQTVRAIDRGRITEPVTIRDRENYYDVVIDLHNCSHRQAGRLLARKIRQVVPGYEDLLDGYLSELVGDDDRTYALFMQRVQAIWPQVPALCREEIGGLAEEFADKTPGRRGDGKLSADEIRLLNLIPDVARGTQCSALAVFGSRSSTRDTLLERTLDWPGGRQNIIARFQSVTTIRNGGSSVCLIGYLGFMGVITGFNNDRVFAAILDAPTGQPYDLAGKRSYPMDLRIALENQTSLTGIADELADPKKQYAFNHLIFLADESRAAVLENDLVPGHRRTLRYDQSPLHPGDTWDFPNALAAVNAFMLKGNFDNFNPVRHNTARWNRFRSLLSAERTVTPAKLKQIAAFSVDGPGTLYNPLTQQIVMFRPAEMALQIFFRPRDGGFPKEPDFNPIPVSFASEK